MAWRVTADLVDSIATALAALEKKRFRNQAAAKLDYENALRGVPWLQDRFGHQDRSVARLLRDGLLRDAAVALRDRHPSGLRGAVQKAAFTAAAAMLTGPPEARVEKWYRANSRLQKTLAQLQSPALERLYVLEAWSANRASPDGKARLEVLRWERKQVLAQKAAIRRLLTAYRG